MRVCSLSSVRNRIPLGQPLPFSVRAFDRTPLLARGQVIASEAQLQELFSRGAVVDVEELAAALQPAVAAATAAPVARLPAIWDRGIEEVRRTLNADSERLAGAIDNTCTQLMELVDRSPEIALAQVVRPRAAGDTHYGITHSMHTAVACVAAARHLGWDEFAQQRAFRAALTMNLAMLELQSRLATQVSPLTQSQRTAIREHPTRSAEMLTQAGITDSDWLDAVASHHELSDGSGYPLGRSDVGELAELIRFADRYTALLSARANRPAMSARDAARQLYSSASGSMLCAAVIKSFGVFPPGSCVRLASGELGIVTRNGDKANQPIVASLTSADGRVRMKPLLRDSASADHAVVSVLPESAMPMRLSPEAVAGVIGSA